MLTLRSSFICNTDPARSTSLVYPTIMISVILGSVGGPAGNARTTSEAACPPCRRQDDVEKSTPSLQDLLWDGMRVRLDGGLFVKIISDLLDSSTRCFLTTERSRIDPVGSAARYMSPNPVFLSAHSHKV